MLRLASNEEWDQMIRLVAEIIDCNEFLEYYKIRIGLDKWTRTQLVKVQMRKVKIIEELKMLAWNFAIIPEPVRKIYY